MGVQEPVPVAILGASGYGGGQLVRLISEHPNLRMTYLSGKTTVGRSIADVYPHLAHRTRLPIEAVDVAEIARRAQIVLLSLPDGVATEFVPDLMAADCQVLDMSADYRFTDAALYEYWYGRTRRDRETMAQAVYGLPELFRQEVTQAKLVGCPDSYPTASLLAIAPLLKHGFIQPDSIIIDAKGGTSCDGRGAPFPHAEADSSLGAYSIGQHRHTPEIEQVSQQLLGHEVQVQFTPHRVPMARGLLTTVYATLRDPGLVAEDLITIYRSFYRAALWVKVMAVGLYPQTKWVCGTNHCFLGIQVDERTGRVIVVAALDNLIKGQAGQAIQCLNLMRGWEENLGLPDLSFFP